jgi:lipopolysaccharide export system permease protein
MISMAGAVGGVTLLRLIGFVSTVFGASVPWMLWLQYVALAVAFGGGLYIIRQGLIIELPSSANEWLASLTDRMMRRVGAQ